MYSGSVSGGAKEPVALRTRQGHHFVGTKENTSETQRPSSVPVKCLEVYCETLSDIDCCQDRVQQAQEEAPQNSQTVSHQRLSSRVWNAPWPPIAASRQPLLHCLAFLRHRHTRLTARAFPKRVTSPVASVVENALHNQNHRRTAVRPTADRKRSQRLDLTSQWTPRDQNQVA